MSAQLEYSKIAWVIAAITLLSTALFFRPWAGGRTISYDPAGYYLYLPAKVIYKDLSTCAFYEEVSKKYRIGDAISHYVPLENGKVVLKYSGGMAILMSPGFFTGDFIAKISNHPRDGYSAPYYISMIFWSIILSLIGLWYLTKVLRRHFDDRSVALTILSLVLATNFLIYAGINNLMSHAFLFSLYAFLIYHTDQWHRKPNWINAIGIALSLGLLALSRPTEIIAFLIPLLWNVWNNLSILSKWNTIKKYSTHILLITILIGLIGSVQLFYWKSVSGDFLFYSYSEQGFDFLKPHLVNGLFSFKKGWLVYTPVMLLSIFGFYHLFRKKRNIFYPLILFSVLFIYITYSWSIWWYGGSVGSRAMIQAYAVLCFPFCALVERLWMSRLQRSILLLFIIICAALNLSMTYQCSVSGGPWQAEFMSKKYYSKILFKKEVDKDYRKYLDTRYEFRSKENPTLLFLNSFEKDSAEIYQNELVTAGEQGIKLSQENRQSAVYSIQLDPTKVTAKNWLRLSCNTYFKNTEWNQWQQTRMYLELWRGDKQLRSHNIRVNWLTDPNQWHQATLEIPLRRTYSIIRPGDKVSIYLRHGNGNHVFYGDEFKLELL